MGDRLATIDVGRKVGDTVPLSDWEPGAHVTQCALGRGISPQQWHVDPSSRLVIIDMAEKLGAAVPLSVG